MGRGESRGEKVLVGRAARRKRVKERGGGIII